MKKYLCLGVLLAATAGLAPGDAVASGSVGPGGVKAAARADYARGKAIVFRELVCRTCPIQRREFNRSRAQSLMNTLRAVAEPSISQQMEGVIATLCNSGLSGCAAKLKLVQTYLQRRYRFRDS